MKYMMHEDLLEFHISLLRTVGLDDESVDAVAVGLCEASLRGIDSHGVRLLPHYVQSAVRGRKNPRPKYRYMQAFPAIGHLDADNAFGHAAGMKAIGHCIDMAKTLGIGVVAVSHSSHAGAMSSMTLRAARQGYLAFAFTHADSLMESYNGTRAYFGTNPICMAAPRKGMEPYCLDMATSGISWNRVLVHRKQNLPLPEGLAADEDGKPTVNPQDAAMLLPIGSYKGYGLASMVEVLCGIYTGMPFGRAIPPMYKAPMERPRHLGQFYIVMRVDACIEASEFEERMTQMSLEINAEPRMGEEVVMLPGDKEAAIARERMNSGIPIDDSTAEAFIMLSEEYAAPLHFVNR